MKRFTLVLLVVVVFVLSTAAVAQDSPLTIWVDDQRLPVITELSKRFTEEFGVEVVVEPVGIQDTREALIRGASTGEGPDLFIIPHDNIVALVDSGVVAPIDLGDKADLFLPNTLEAFTYNGELYGVPYAIENDAFFRNVELVPDAPATWDEVSEIGKQLVDEGTVENAIALPDLGYNYFPL